MYATAGEHLTQRMRKMTFEAMLRQEIGWFDDPSNSTGALCSRLSADAGALQGVCIGKKFEHEMMNIKLSKVYRLLI